MPIYSYRCSSCGHEKDVLQKVSDAPLTDCTACGAPSLSKQLTAAGFQLKGSGWYATDFKNSGKGASKSTPAEGAKPEGGKPEGGKPEGAGGGESKSESKSEAPSDKGAASSCAAG